MWFSKNFFFANFFLRLLCFALPCLDLILNNFGRVFAHWLVNKMKTTWNKLLNCDMVQATWSKKKTFSVFIVHIVTSVWSKLSSSYFMDVSLFVDFSWYFFFCCCCDDVLRKRVKLSLWIVRLSKHYTLSHTMSSS